MLLAQAGRLLARSPRLHRNARRNFQSRDANIVYPRSSGAVPFVKPESKSKVTGQKEEKPAEPLKATTSTSKVIWLQHAHRPS